jgi:HK97 family phage major capsid protein
MMELKEMTIEQLEERKAAIVAELDAPEADLDALESEARAIKEELESRKAEAAKKAEIREAVAVGGGTVTKTFDKEEKKTMTIEEIRSMPSYMDAYANYIKTGRDTECRAILTDNAGNITGKDGPVPVPVIVDEIVRTAWERDEIASRLRRTFFRGNLKVAFELSADPDVIHAEGSGAIDEENLQIGIINMVPQTIKKFVRISDEAVTMGGEAFIRYIYDELTYQIIRKVVATAVGAVAGAGTASSASAVGVPKVAVAPSLTAVGTAFANLSDEAANNVVIMNKLTYANFLAAQAGGNFGFDPFMGMTVLFNNTLPAYDSATAGDVYAIVGDLSGVQANYPEGDGVAIKYDDLSEAEADMVKIVGRQYVAIALTAPGRFVNLTKPNA